jgi:hypothetical protein
MRVCALNPMALAIVRMSLDRRHADQNCQQRRDCKQAQSHFYSPHLSSQTARIQRANAAETREDSPRVISSSVYATMTRRRFFFDFLET